MAGSGPMVSFSRASTFRRFIQMRADSTAPPAPNTDVLFNTRQVTVAPCTAPTLSWQLYAIRLSLVGIPLLSCVGLSSLVHTHPPCIGLLSTASPVGMSEEPNAR
ncbi:hypothetical protein H257_16457 [Aphanomyces astaci]|uniref:Uncharacterized protein n=1 Tax=Aphanomyces astaci TaxID=112090 RepID=W4FIM6_APHAT|nr:hypothetical protein H257_16457 [Aphanomyces astaci]ETV67372.1 hypothetical protein H257_16457 [Aphanomyces astaci]|eukprot:XP_009843187.1 hypothetical protein H257_16457 [Aphanomyces astaci]